MSNKNLIPPIVLKWSKSLRNKDLEGILSCYADNAILLGTLAKNIKISHSEIRPYFEMLFKKKNLDVKFHDVYDMYPNLGTTCISGTYTFSYIDEYGLLIRVPSRFTYVVRGLIDTKITTHHSSKNP
tara:strand:- start:4175 stop:4555 length:381 start_codon:yes stop_codon:yes gene_type:complete